MTENTPAMLNITRTQNVMRLVMAEKVFLMFTPGKSEAYIKDAVLKYKLKAIDAYTKAVKRAWGKLTLTEEATVGMFTKMAYTGEVLEL